MKPPLRLAALAVLVTVALTGCTPVVALQPAVNATDPLCAAIVVALPDTVVDLPLVETNAQGTGAWGTPESVLLRCGVPVPDPTSALPCVQVGEVYWLRDGTDAPDYVFTTYGRTPATEVIVDQTKVSPGAALVDLENAVAQTTVVSGCTEIEDSLGVDATATPTPTPTPSATPPTD